MRNIFLVIALFVTTQAQANRENREGSLIQDKATGSIIYFTCGVRDITGECNSYQAFLEQPFPRFTPVILPVPGPMEKTLIHSSLFTALLDTKDIYITGEPINLKKYNVTEKFFNKTNGDKFSFGNVIIKALISPLTLTVGIVETLIDQPQNLYMKTKAIVLKAKYKKPLKRLFMGKQNKTYAVRGKKFQKIVKLIKNIK